MKDKDFDDIGKRLYDMEAEPPKDGWKKIMGGVNKPPASGRIIFLRKNWWKPLVLLIPIGVYLLLPGSSENISSLTPAENGDTVLLNPTADGMNGTNASSTEPDKSSTASGEIEAITKNEEGTNQVDQPKKRTSAQNKKLPLKKEQTTGLDDNQVTLNGSSQQTKNNLTQVESEKASLAKGTKGQKKIIPLVVIPSQTGIEAKPTSENINAELMPGTSKIDENKPSLTQAPEIAAMVKATEQDKQNLTPGENISGKEDANGKKVVSVEENKSSIAPTVDSTVFLSSPLGQTTNSDTNTIENAKNELKSTENAVKADSISSQETAENTGVLLLEEAQKQEEGKETAGVWRISFALTPQYNTKTIKPVANDEVLMVDSDNKNGSYQEQIGLGIAIGLGKAITPDLYIDAQLTFHQAKQDISYSFSTGEVDTLLALQQPDGSIRVSPVYDLHSSDITSKYSYGGIRISGTYYFWSRPGRRFNITGGAGIDQLLSSSLEEKIDGKSIPKNGDYLNKTNFSFVIGAGYNISFRRGWELMINPTMTYYLLKEKSEDSLYNFNQRSYGLNFMLSKTISLKK